MDYLTVAEAAQELGITPGRVYHLIDGGELPATKLLGRIAIKRSDLKLVKNRPKPGRPQKTK